MDFYLDARENKWTIISSNHVRVFVSLELDFMWKELEVEHVKAKVRFVVVAFCWRTADKLMTNQWKLLQLLHFRRRSSTHNAITSWIESVPNNLKRSFFYWRILKKQQDNNKQFCYHCLRHSQQFLNVEKVCCVALNVSTRLRVKFTLKNQSCPPPVHS